MVDTVCYRQFATPLPFNNKTSGTDWKPSNQSGKTESGHKYQNETLKHVPTGLTIRFRAGRTEAEIQASLPKVLLGQNARLILSQKQLEAALTEVDRLVQQVATVSTPAKRFYRVDLVWQFKGKIHDFILAHQVIRHPEIDKLPINYHWQTILWKGDGMSISMYDKVLEQTGKPGNIVRVEMRFTKRKLKAELGNAKTPTILNFPRCYQVYRDKLVKFCPVTVHHLSKASDLLYFATKEKWEISGMLASDYLALNMSPKSATRMREQIQHLKLKRSKMDWKQTLPPGKPPHVRNCLFRGKGTAPQSAIKALPLIRADASITRGRFP